MAPQDAKSAKIAVEQAFAAWLDLPPGDAAEGEVLLVAAFLTHTQQIQMLKRLLGSQDRTDVRELLSSKVPCGLIRLLPLFELLGGEGTQNLIWDLLPLVAKALRTFGKFAQ